ncbi:MAG: hypothetical protein AB7O26_20475 [Planctomycetaceae bacterium]
MSAEPVVEQPKTPSAVRHEALAANAATGTAAASTSRRRLAGMIGAIVLLAVAGFLAWPVAFEPNDSELDQADIASNDAPPAVSLGKKSNKVRPEEIAPDVGSLVWREPSEKTIRKKKEARRRAMAEARQNPEASLTVPANQMPAVVRGRTIVRTAVENGPMLGAPETSIAADIPTSRQTAQQLVREARVALTEGRIDEAKQKAIAADRLNVAFALFEDRPSAILAEIAKLQSPQAGEERTAELPAPAAPVLTDPISIDPPADGDPELTQSAPAPSRGNGELPKTVADEDLGFVELPELNSSNAQLPEPAVSQPIPAPVESPVASGEPLPEVVRTEPAAPVVRQYPHVSDQPLTQPSGPQLRITPGEIRNPIPDNGVRLSFDFHAAPWEFVLTQFAAKVRRPIDMTLVPAGTLTYVDQQVYSAQETLTILNVLLIEKGFALIHRDGRLILKPQPSAISSRTDVPSQDEARLAQEAAGTKVRAAALLTDARRDISTGNLDDALTKVRRAASLNAVFGLLDDRPETVLEEIRRVAAEPQQLMPEPPSAVLPHGNDPWLTEKRMSINFQDAGWELVMREFAKAAGLDLLMESPPSGTFTHVDTSLYSPAQTLEIINGFLSRVGFQAFREGNTLRVTRIETVLRGLR